MFNAIAGLALIGGAIAASPREHEESVELHIIQANNSLNRCRTALSNKNCGNALRLYLEATHHIGMAQAHADGAGPSYTSQMDGVLELASSVYQTLARSCIKR